LDRRKTEELIEAARNGEEDAFARLYSQHCRWIYSLCLRMTRSPSEAEDLPQETFLRAFRKLRTFRGEAAFRTWLYRLGTNVVLMRFRKKSRPEVSLEEMAGPDGAIAAARDPAPRADTAGLLAVRLSVRQAFKELPEGFKRALVFHDLHGYTHAEIAEMADRSVGNSKSQLHGARRRLREILSERDVEPAGSNVSRKRISGVRS
jgi:RNA polymerase sigma-70 factor (ECF subfamily)